MEIEFYKLISQIIPILFLGVTLQSVFISRGEKYNSNEDFIREIHILLFVFVVALLCMGEFVALRSVYLGYSYPSDLFIVTLTIGASIVWIVLDHILALKGKSKEIYSKGFLIVFILTMILEAYYIFR